MSESIKRYGFIVPVITNRDLVIADGEQRWTAAQSLGMVKIPVIRLDIEDVDRRLLRQVLNKLKGQHEEDLDAWEYQRIIQAGEEETLKNLILLRDADIEKSLRLINEPRPEEEWEPPAIDSIKTDIVHGTVLTLGNHRLMCGDATNRDDVEKLMNGDKADMVFTDPPYNVKMEGYDDDKTALEYRRFSESWFKQAKTLNSLVIFTPGCGHNLANLQMWFEIERPYWLAIWVKTNSMTHNSIGGFQAWEPVLIYGKPTRKIPQDVYNVPITVQADVADEQGRKLHPTPKSVKLWVEVITDFAYPKGCIVDLFGGTGPTVIACEQIGRIARVMELDPRYCQVIVDRWEKYSGQKAVKVD